jgi:hypothetical protein
LERGSPVAACMDGTRQDILASIDEWANDFNAPNILWLKGFPGSGKSAVASTMVDKLRRSHRLGSCFFFERANASRTTTSALWRTVAFDLARQYPSFRKVAIDKLNEDEVDPNASNVNILFRHLIDKPLKACIDIPPGRLPVVVVDALDECGGLDGHRSSNRKSLLDTVKRWLSLPSRFKLIVTSRGEADIIRVLSPISHCIELSSGRTVSSQTSGDIHRFLTQQLSDIASGYPDSLSPEWPSSAIIEELTGRAAGLFVWAKTLVEFVHLGEPQEQLLQIRKGDVGYGDMAVLYTRILETSFKRPSANLAHWFRAVAGTIIAAKIPLSRKDFIHLLGVEPLSMLDTILMGLQSVMDNGDILRFSHQSFVDFLVDPESCPPMFLINKATQNRDLALASLQVMKIGLRFNICQLGSSHVHNDDVPDLGSRIEREIPAHLSYSCRFWADHLRATAFEPDILAAVQFLMHTQLLYWLEVMSLIKEVNIASQALLFISNWIRVRLYLVIRRCRL